MAEYDYSNLYNQNNQQGIQPTGGYPNVGSSGMNTANTARTDYSGNNANSQQTYGQPGYQGYQGNAYSSNYGGYNNGYSYTNEPPKPAKKGNGKKILLRVMACVGVVALGFGGGFAGAMVAGRTGTAGGGTVVVQRVERGETESVMPSSVTGNALSIQEVAAIAEPSVVSITTEQMVSSNTWFGGSYIQSGAGSGVVMSRDGYILTCAHVVSGATNVIVHLGNDTDYTATVVGADAAADIAVLKVEADNLVPAVMGDSDTLAVGETAIAVGNPLGTLEDTVSQGIVSALNREVTVERNKMTLIQTDAAVSPGNSGGGLYNLKGELIGIVNAKSTSSYADGIGFAIPINTAMDVAEELINHGFVKRPALGINVVTVKDAAAAQQYGVSAMGVYIANVNAGSGAEQAGLKAGDRIVSIGDRAVSISTDVTDYLSDKEVGDVVTLQVEREGKIVSFDVTLGASTGE